VTRQPQCPACGDRTLACEESKVELSSVPKTAAHDGHRTIGPAETVRRYQRQISPITGAVGALRRWPVDEDGDLHVYVADHNLGSSSRDLKHLQRTLRSSSSGKGVTDLQARASALCEGLERYCGVFRGTEPRRRASFRELAGEGIHPNDCMGFSERQYEQRDIINALGLRFYQVPLMFDDSARIEWTRVWSLTHRAHRSLPTEYCYYDYPAADNERYTVACSNGNAAGSTIEEAILHGVLEVVERDSAALWWYNRICRPPLDLTAFDEPYLAKAERFLASRHRDLWTLDLTSDLGIPACAALSRRTDGGEEHILIGLGAHLDAKTALVRAVTELIQLLTWVIPSSPQVEENLAAIDDPHTTAWLKTATVANQPYLAADPGARRPGVLDYTASRSTDLKDDVLLCCRLLARHGMEVLVLDQTRPDIGLPVVKVIVPGLRHFWARFAAGRLYDVPARLGWLSRPLEESELNPVPMFL
jgi:ribosomal protein S12 methylthiotransferase accessory factor